MLEAKVKSEECSQRVTSDASVSSPPAAAVSGGSGAGAGDEDPVVCEVPVYCSRRLSRRLWLLQYPVRPATRPYTHSLQLPGAGAQLRVRQQQLRLQLPLDTTGPCYDVSRGQQMAQNAEAGGGGGDAGGAARFPSGHMDRQELMGRRVDVDPRRHCVGALSTNGCGQLELHLTPLAAVLTVRPSFSHLETRPAKTSAGAGGAEDAASAPAAERVTVKFARPAGTRAKPHPLAAIKQEEEEPWRPARLAGPRHGFAVAERRLLLAPGTEDGREVGPLSADQYRSRLLPEPAQDSAAAAAGGASLAELPLRQLRQLPLPDQLHALLARQHLCRLSQLLEQLQPPVSAKLQQPLAPSSWRDHVVRQLQQVARLVRGLWTVRSELLYPPGDPRLPGRDLLLYWFTQRRLVTRQQLLHAARPVGLTPEHALQLLAALAVPLTRTTAAAAGGGAGWRLKLPADPSLESDYPELVQRQQLLWTARHTQLLRQLEAAGASSLDSGSGGGTAELPRKQSGGRGRRRSSSSHSQSDSAKSRALADHKPCQVK